VSKLWLRKAIVPFLIAGSVVLGADHGLAQTSGNGDSRIPNAPPAGPAANPDTSLGATLRNVTYNNRVYETGAAALDAARQDHAQTMAALVREADPVRGKVRIVLADRNRLRPLVQVPGKALSQAASDYLVEFRWLGEREVADAIAKARVFEQATIVEQNDTLDPELRDADFLVWYRVRSMGADNTGPWTAGWQIKRAGNNAISAVNADPGVPVGAPRLNSLLKSARESALRLGGTSVAGAKATPAARVAGSGSGILIDANGHVLTNNHVVSACAEIRLTNTDHVTEIAVVAARDETNDLALLKLPHGWNGAATLRASKTLRPGENVVVTGYPLSGLVGSEMSLTTGSITSLVGPRDDTRRLQISAPIQPGNSGGPLTDAAGNVIGVVSNTLNALVVGARMGGALPQNVNFAIKASIAQLFLDANNIPYAFTADRPVRELSAADVGDIARRFTVRVECRQ
jgi:S1-C subfamily serine protease